MNSNVVLKVSLAMILVYVVQCSNFIMGSGPRVAFVEQTLQKVQELVGQVKTDIAQVQNHATAARLQHELALAVGQVNPQAQAGVKDLSGQVAQLQARIRELEGALRHGHAGYDQLRSRYERLEGQFAGLQGDTQQKSMAQERLAQELDQTRDRMGAREQELEQLRQQLEQARVDLARYQENIRQAEADRRDSEGRLQAELNGARREADGQKAELQELREQLRDMTATRDRAAAAAEQSHAREAEMQKRVGAQDALVAEMRAAQNAGAQEKAQLQKKIDRMEINAAQEEQQRQGIGEVNRQLRQENAALKQEIARLTELVQEYGQMNDLPKAFPPLS